MTKIPIACTLTADETATRVDAWRSVLTRALTREVTSSGARLTFRVDATIATELADLVVREVECCPFFTFDLKVDNHALVLDVSAPDEAHALVTALFAPA